MINEDIEDIRRRLDELAEKINQLRNRT